VIRPATIDDVGDMVRLSARKRHAYADVHPVFWRPAPDADTAQTRYFSSLVDDTTAICIVDSIGDVIHGFAIGLLRPAPDVYEPGGLTCTIDDCAVDEPGSWSTVGTRLVTAVADHAVAQGAIQVVVVTGSHDRAKRQALESVGLRETSVWYSGLPTARDYPTTWPD
jgi:hypothetical protein